MFLELATRIRAAIFSITEQTLQKVVESTELRMGVLQRQMGAISRNV